MQKTLANVLRKKTDTRDQEIRKRKRIWHSLLMSENAKLPRGSGNASLLRNFPHRYGDVDFPALQRRESNRFCAYTVVTSFIFWKHSLEKVLSNVLSSESPTNEGEIAKAEASFRSAADEKHLLFRLTITFRKSASSLSSFFVSYFLSFLSLNILSMSPILVH